jgi:hypothetical protein
MIIFKMTGDVLTKLRFKSQEKYFSSVTQANESESDFRLFIIVCSVSSRPQYVFMKSCLRQKKLLKLSMSILCGSWYVFIIHIERELGGVRKKFFFSFESDVYACYKPCIVSFHPPISLSYLNYYARQSVDFIFFD